MPNHPPLDWLTESNLEGPWMHVDLYATETQMDDGGRPQEDRRDIYINGCGGLIEVHPDGSWSRLVPQNAIPHDAPAPMWGTTERNGVVGYMCLIDFECELGAASGGNRVYPSAKEALCASTCGVAEVEVIGRKIITPGTWDDLSPRQAGERLAVLNEVDAQHETDEAIQRRINNHIAAIKKLAGGDYKTIMNQLVGQVVAAKSLAPGETP